MPNGMFLSTSDMPRAWIEESRNHIEIWPVGMKTGLMAWQHLFQVMMRPKEPVSPSLMQISVIWGGRGPFDSKPHDHRLPRCSLQVLVFGASLSHTYL